MENGKWEMENEKRDAGRGNFSALQFPNEKICSACGSDAQRRSAKFCSVCGKLLLEEYQPLDRFRASYRLQGKSFIVEKDREPENNAVKEAENLFDENKNSASETARAFVVYSLVPYLGILFCPFAILIGGIGIFVSCRKPYLGGGRTSVYSIALGFIMFAVQVFLWWLLYFIPEIGKRI
jgi:hypothetical protein